FPAAIFCPHRRTAVPDPGARRTTMRVSSARIGTTPRTGWRNSASRKCIRARKTVRWFRHGGTDPTGGASKCVARMAGGKRSNRVPGAIERLQRMARLPLIDAPLVDYGSEEPAMVRYREDGTRRALALANRGPIMFDAAGRPDPAILDAYSRCGFYVFEGVI